MTKLLTGLIALFAATSAFAIDMSGTSVWNCRDYGNNFATCRAPAITSATTLASLGAIEIKPASNVYLSTVGSLASTSATVFFIDRDGNTLNTQAINIASTAGLTTFALPQYFTHLKVSPTTVLSATNSISVTIIESK